jgi:hypothetical protein
LHSTKRSAAPSTRKGGRQHPSYDISMSGTGDVIMTDVRTDDGDAGAEREPRGALLRADRVAGSRRRVYKPRGRAVELAVEAGTFTTRASRARREGSLVARTQVADGARVVLDAREFGQAARAEPTQRRGPAPSLPRFAGRDETASSSIRRMARRPRHRTRHVGDDR